MTTAEATINTEVKFAEFPFTYLGVEYVSKIDPQHPRFQLIQSIGAERFADINIGALEDLGNIKEDTTREEITKVLERLNKNGSWAFIELAGE